jgi:hypothetical protein
MARGGRAKEFQQIKISAWVFGPDWEWLEAKYPHVVNAG